MNLKILWRCFSWKSTGCTDRINDNPVQSMKVERQLVVAKWNLAIDILIIDNLLR